MIFDGSTHQGEALAVILRCIDREWKPLQRQVSLRVLAKSMDGAELVGELLSCLSTLFQLKPIRLLLSSVMVLRSIKSWLPICPLLCIERC